MIHSERIKELLEEQVEAEVRRRLEIAHIDIYIDGDRVDISDQTLNGEIIEICIGNPVFLSDKGKVRHFSDSEPKKMKL